MVQAFDVQIKSDRIKVKLDELPDEIRTDLKATTRTLAEELKSVAQALASGPLVKTITGKYAASFRVGVRSSKSSVTGRVHSKAPQAAILEFGGTIPAHDILPKTAQALAFMGSAGQVFAARVHHPASHIDKRGVLHQALSDMEGAIVAELKGAVAGATSRVSES